MADKHNQTFFSQKVGLIVQSSSKDKLYLFFQCIKKKNDENWEKTTLNEGKTVKISIEEIIQILSVLSMKSKKWSTVHTFNNDNTIISINRDDQNGAFWINVGDYERMLKFPQSEFLKLLLRHILQEKIEFATSQHNAKT